MIARRSGLLLRDFHGRHLQPPTHAAEAETPHTPRARQRPLWAPSTCHGARPRSRCAMLYSTGRLAELIAKCHAASNPFGGANPENQQTPYTTWIYLVLSTSFDWYLLFGLLGQSPGRTPNPRSLGDLGSLLRSSTPLRRQAEWSQAVSL